MVRAVGEDGPHVDERVAREHAALHRLLDAGVDRGDVLARDHAAGDLVDELVAAARARWARARCTTWPYWPRPPVWRM